MGKVLDFINQEKNTIGKVYVDISYAIDNISPFLDKKTLDNRKYVHKLTSLKQYMDLLQQTELDEKKDGVLGFINDNSRIDKLKNFKYTNGENITQLQKCSSCACLNCTAECNFDNCLGCRKGSHIEKCDHKKINITLHDSYFLDLNNDRTNTVDHYKVLATLQDEELDRKYIIIQNQHTNEEFVLYYYPGISEDTYGEITDDDEFDFINSTYENLK